MHFTHAVVWDKGDYYTVNQDSFSLQMVLTGKGPYAMALVCDGIGGLSSGEEASGYTVRYMTTWFYEQGIPLLCRGCTRKQLARSCRRALGDVHGYLLQSGNVNGKKMGTTFTMLILEKERYYIFHVGDCHCYLIGKRIRKLTNEHLNEKGELIHAVGVGEEPRIEARCGRYGRKNTFLLCSDGFAGCLSLSKLKALKQYEKEWEYDERKKLMQEILARGRQKGEKDNCTGILIRRTK